MAGRDIPVKPMTEDRDYTYIIHLIEYLSRRHGVRFFVSSGDFDQLYSWWEKRIPEKVIRMAFDNVVERRVRRKQPLVSFANFRYEVRKQYSAWLEREIGGPPPAESTLDPVEEFMKRFPVEIAGLKPLFAAAASDRLNGREVDVPGLRRALAERFSGEKELETRVRTFMLNLSPELRKARVEQAYRGNYLWNRFGIPDFNTAVSREPHS